MFIHCPEKDLLVNINKSFAKLKIPKWENSRLIADRKELFNLHLPYLYEKSVLNFLNRVQLSGESAKAGELIDELLSRVPSSRASAALPLPTIDRDFAALSAEFRSLDASRAEALRRGNRFARAGLSLGFLLLGGQVLLVVYGVYVFYNWDIMEPIMYFLQYAGVLALGSLFFLMRGKYEHQTFARWLAKRYQHARLRKTGFDERRYQNLLELLKQNHNDRLKNILNDF